MNGGVENLHKYKQIEALSFTLLGLLQIGFHTDDGFLWAS